MEAWDLMAVATAYLVEAFAVEVDLLVVLRVLPFEEPFRVEALVEDLFLLKASVHLVLPSCPHLFLVLIILVAVPSFEVAFPSASAHLFPLASPYPLVEAASAVSEQHLLQLFDVPNLVVLQHS